MNRSLDYSSLLKLLKVATLPKKIWILYEKGRYWVPVIDVEILFAVGTCACERMVAERIRNVKFRTLDYFSYRFDVSVANKHPLTRAEFLAYCENQDAILAINWDVIDEEVVSATGK